MYIEIPNILELQMHLGEGLKCRIINDKPSTIMDQKHYTVPSGGANSLISLIQSAFHNEQTFSLQLSDSVPYGHARALAVHRTLAWRELLDKELFMVIGKQMKRVFFSLSLTGCMARPPPKK